MRITTLLLLPALALLAGCEVFESSFSGEPQSPVPFNHAVHADLGADCATCHAGSGDADAAGMPDKAACLMCHEAPAGEYAGAHEELINTLDEWEWVVRNDFDDVLFSHANHGGFDCADCHGDVGTSAKVTSAVRVSMDGTCFTCHDEQRSECSMCHSTISLDSAPPNHDGVWMRAHGSEAWNCSLPEEAGGNCAICHSASDCNSCHLTELPTSHTESWTQRGHGVVASIDRQSCAVCHKEDGCIRCHQETAPSYTHNGNWGGSLNLHCVSCHIPAGSSGDNCAVCHRSTPSHLAATPMPGTPGHTPTADCRSCHVGGAGVAPPTPHVDNGQSCVLCHK